MYIDSLVFSNKPNFRIPRHVFFWLGWISYFTAEATLRRTEVYGFHVAIFSSVSEVLASTPIDMAFCYSIIYFLFPRFLFRGMYVKMVMLWFLFALLGFFIYRGFNVYIVPHIHDFYGMKRQKIGSTLIWAFFYFFLTFNMEGCLAAAIKLGKMWYIKKSENDVLTYQKEQMEAFIHNDHAQSHFLFHTFSRVHDISLEKAPEIAGMISSLQKITLFIVSQYQYTQVDIEKEIQILHEFIELERAGTDNYGNYSIEVSGEMAGKKVASFILLPLVENIFSQQVNKNDMTDFVMIKAAVIKDVLKFEIQNSKPHQTSSLINPKRDTIYQIKKRLNLLYPGSHQLSVIIETELVKTYLEINLGSIVLS
ncbi:MAG: histidine kinase [Ferruginibacter sp.]|nr:histidine kinase [Ferruginibacter sp.]